MSNTHYNAIVIGAGPGGYPCAIRLGQLGRKTLVVEKDNWGGVCLNVGCIPSKAVITASKRYKELQSAADFGIKVDGDITADMAAIQKFKSGVVTKLTKGIAQLLQANKVDMVKGTATVTASNQVTVSGPDGDVVYTADNIVVATGSRPIEIPGFSYDDPRIMHSTGALELTEVPKHLVVIGGGVIGLELGMAYAKLGAEVTVVEMSPNLLPSVDKDAVKIVARKAKKSGIKVLVNTSAKGWSEGKNGTVIVEIEGKKGVQQIEADKVLVSVGRRPNSEGLGLDTLGVKIERGFIQIDERMRTNVPSIFAIGDLVGQPMLAHKATHEGELVAEIIAGHDVVYDAQVIPAVIFTDPEVAVAGLSEAEAKELGPIKVGKVPYAAVGRALTTNETDGFYKVVLDANDDTVLGVTIVGANACDLISEASLAIEMGCTGQDIGLTIHPHPTFGEGMMEAAKAALGEAIHIINK